MTDAYPIRAVSEAEYAGFFAVDQQAFNSTRMGEPVPQDEQVTFEPGRSLAAFDGQLIVGTAGAFSLQMTVPGAVAPVAGISYVAVLPSHRRRGILTSLMRRQLGGLADHGEAVAALWASEPGIYGRFGYGVASMKARFVVRRGENQMVRLPAPGSTGAVRVRSAEPDPSTAELAKVYDQAAVQRPGMLARDDRWWRAALYDLPALRGGSGPLRCVVAEDDSGARGYALYCVTPSWDQDSLPAAVLRVRELMSLDPAATAALWADLLSRDLVGEVRARLRPADDPLLYLLTDLRRARTQLSDGLWVRLVDVGTALAQRDYSREVDTVIEVTDDLLPANTGRWHLQAGPDGTGAQCERTSAPADVALPVAALGAAYLGGTRLGALARAGQVSELRAGTLAALSTAMSWDPAPWCPVVF